MFDYLLALELANHAKRFEGEAVWLVFMSTIALVYLCVLRWEIYKQRKLGPMSQVRR